MMKSHKTIINNIDKLKLNRKDSIKLNNFSINDWLVLSYNLWENNYIKTYNLKGKFLKLKKGKGLKQKIYFQLLDRNIRTYLSFFVNSPNVRNISKQKTKKLFK